MFVSMIYVCFRLLIFPVVWWCVSLIIAFVSALIVATFRQIRNKNVTKEQELKIGSLSIVIGLMISIMMNI